MRKKRMAVMALLLLLLTGCDRNTEAQVVVKEEVKPSYEGHLIESKKEVTSKEPFVIDESQFLKQLNNIFYYLESYQDRDIVVEGFFGYPYLKLDEEGIAPDAHLSKDGSVPAVYRNSPGCCGHDGWAGFLLEYDGEYPEEGAWIKVTGKPDVVRNEQGGFSLSLAVSSIEVLDTQGLDFVTQ